jgi:hypothetical protein
MARSWLVTGIGLDVNLARVIGVALICAIAVGFFLAGLATVGILVPSSWWPVLVVGSAAASAVMLALFFNPQLVLAFGVDVVLVWIIVAKVWSPTTAPST